MVAALLTALTLLVSGTATARWSAGSRRERTALTRGDVGAFLAGARRNAAARLAPPTAVPWTEAARRLLAAASEAELERLGDAALSSADAAAPELFDVVFELRREQRTRVIERRHRRRAWALMGDHLPRDGSP